MSYLYIAAIAVAACVILMIYSLISQTIEQKKREQRRLVSALDRRIATLQDLNYGLPKGVFTPNLHALLLNELIAACKQLVALSPDHPNAKQFLKAHSDELTAASQSSPENMKLTGIKEIKVAKSKLLNLKKLLVHSVKQRKVTTAQAKVLEQELENNLQKVDLASYDIAAKAAKGAGKFQVAIHYYEQAKQLLLSSKDPKAKSNLAKIEQTIQALRKNLDEQQTEQPTTPPPEETSEEENKELWQKKQVYD